jgi:hypothetical protein
MNSDSAVGGQAFLGIYYDGYSAYKNNLCGEPIGCCFFMAGCGGPTRSGNEPNKPAATIEPNATIGSLAEVFSFEPIPVEEYGLVGGLNGTGHRKKDYLCFIFRVGYQWSYL